MPFIGHQKIWEQLRDDARRERLPASLLFYGTHGIGKKLVARDLAGLYFCEGRKGCGQCPACLKLAENRHPDFFLIEPGEKASIKIDAIRDVRQKLKYAPLESPVKIVLIEDAHLLTEGASNSLLKMLEDPPQSTHFILLAPSLFPILPTIRSRCRKLFFSPPPIAELASVMASQWACDEGRAQTLLQTAGGSPGLASFLLQEGVEEALRELEGVLEKKSDFDQVAAIAKSMTALSDDVDLSLLLEVMACRYFQKHRQQPTDAVFGQLSRLMTAKKDLKARVNPTLVFESL